MSGQTNSVGVAKVPFVIGVTGHRDLVADELPTIRERVRELFAGLQRQFPELPILVMTPLAEGADRLVAEVAKVTAAKGIDPDRPPFWGGFRILPLEIEFWADGAFRLHDRFCWSRNSSGEAWKIARRNP